MIDQASVFAERFRNNPQILQATVLGQGNVPGLDPYTALNALKLIKESNMMAMAGRAQQPTSSPSIVAETLAPAPSPQGLGAMVPNTMGQMPPGAPQGLAAMAPQQRALMPQQAPVMQRSGGLAGMPTPEENYAEGGIVAFQSGGLNSGESMEATAVTDDPFSRLIAEAEGTGAPSSTALSRAEEALNKYMTFVPKEMSEKEQEAFLDRYMARVKKAGGEDIYAPEIARGAQDEADRAKARRVGEAGAYFTAAGKVLKGRSLAEGASEALPAFGSAMNEVEKLDQAAKTANARAQFLLKDAQRKERMGDARGAQAALAEARKFQQDANKAEGDKLRFSADIAARTVQYSRPAKAAGSGDASTKLPQVDRDAAAIAKQIIDLESANPDDPKLPALKQKLVALEKIIAATKTSEAGPGKLGAQESQIFVGAARDATNSARKRGNQDAAYLTALRNRDTAAANNRMKEIYAEEIQKFFPNTPLSDLLAAAPPGDLMPASAGAPAPAASKPAAQKALPVPASKDDLKINQLYNTNQGLGIWNGKSFTAQ